MDVENEHKRLLSAYRRAEDVLHSLGIETGEGIDTTAVNELRYVGRQTVVPAQTVEPAGLRVQQVCSDPRRTLPDGDHADFGGWIPSLRGQRVQRLGDDLRR